MFVLIGTLFNSPSSSCTLLELVRRNADGIRTNNIIYLKYCLNMLQNQPTG